MAIYVNKTSFDREIEALQKILLAIVCIADTHGKKVVQATGCPAS